MSASEKIQRNKKAVAFEDETKVSPRESRSRSRLRSRDRRAKSMDVRGLSKEGTEPRKRDRGLIGLVRQGSRKSVSSLVKLFEAGKNFYVSILAVIFCPPPFSVHIYVDGETVRSLFQVIQQ